MKQTDQNGCLLVVHVARTCAGFGHGVLSMEQTPVRCCTRSCERWCGVALQVTFQDVIPLQVQLHACGWIVVQAMPGVGFMRCVTGCS